MPKVKRQHENCYQNAYTPRASKEATIKFSGETPPEPRPQDEIIVKVRKHSYHRQDQQDTIQSWIRPSGYWKKDNMKDIIKQISDHNDLRPNRGAQHIKKEQDILKNA